VGVWNELLRGEYPFSQQPFLTKCYFQFNTVFGYLLILKFGSILHISLGSFPSNGSTIMSGQGYCLRSSLVSLFIFSGLEKSRWSDGRAKTFVILQLKVAKSTPEHLMQKQVDLHILFLLNNPKKP
jgi:hypothetical protein